MNYTDNNNDYKDTDCVSVCVWCLCVGGCVCGVGGRSVCVCVCITLLTEWFHVSDFQIPEVLNECVNIPGSLVCIAILYGGTYVKHIQCVNLHNHQYMTEVFYLFPTPLSFFLMSDISTSSII